MAGLTDQGFEAKTQPELLQQFKELLAADFGAAVDTSTDQAVMQLADVVIMELEELWQGYQLQYNFLNPNSAEGVSLDNIGAITNTPRLSGAKSVVTVNATGTEGSPIALGFIRSVQDTGAQFRTTEAHTLPADGLQPLVFTMDSVEDGEIAAPANTLNQGPLPSGVVDIINPTDAELGSNDETDEQYRIGRVARLAAVGAGTVVAIKAALLTVDGMDENGVAVFENDTSIPDPSFTPTLPDHSIRCLVAGSFAPQDVIDTIGTKKGAGTYTDGTVSGTYTDPTDGQTFTIRYSLVTQTAMYVTVNLLETNSEYQGSPAGEEAIETAILAVDWDVAEDIILPKLQGAVVSIPGIVEYELFFDDAITPTTDTTVTIAEGFQGDFDSTRTIVNAVP
jgi:hypothetical protein